MIQSFNGCPEDMYRFFWEIAFQNNKDFFEQNRSRYEKNVKGPMQALARDLIPLALQIDPDFDTRVPVVVSRIRRDTRYTYDKSPYRDHVWLGFRPMGTSTGETFVIYAAFERTGYSYGMGMYMPNPVLMQEMRSRIIARPDVFLSLIHGEAFQSVFTSDLRPYKRKKFSHADSEIETWLNTKSIGFHFSSPNISETYTANIEEQIKRAFDLMKPVYRFLKGLD